MPSLHDLCLLGASLGAGLIAGLCFAFASFILPAFDRLGAAGAIRAMQSVNAKILRSSAMAAWFGTMLLGVLGSVLGDGRPLDLAATALYGLGAFLITGRGNVPLNEELDRVDPDGPNSVEAWQHYRLWWGRWNYLRTVACASASACFAWAL